jgi:hypothetical protein
VSIVAAASVLATAPVWIPAFPPMTDLPQHAAQIAMLRAVRDPSFAYASLFTVNWFTPYLFGYLLVYALVPILGMVMALKAVIAVALAALPVSTALVMGETGTDQRLALLAIPAMYGFSYHWGFLNFIVGAPVAMVFVWLTLCHARRPTAAGAVALAAAIVLLFFCHALLCVFFGAIAGCMLLVGARTWRDACLRVLPLASVVPIVLLWTRTSRVESAATALTRWDLSWLTSDDPYYNSLASWTSAGGAGWGRLTGFLPRVLGALPGPATTAAGLVIILLPWMLGYRLTRRRATWVPILFCVAVLAVVPGTLFGVAFIYQRFAAFALPLYLIVFERTSPKARWSWLACGATAAAWTAFVVVNVLRFQAAASGFDEILARMQPGQRVLSFAFERDSPGTIAPPFLHFPAWYAGLKGGIVDPSGAATLAVPVVYRRDRIPAARPLGFEWTPLSLDWRAFHGEQYRYFVARAALDMAPTMFRKAPCTIRLVQHVNHWWLYEADQRCTAAAGA